MSDAVPPRHSNLADAALRSLAEGQSIDITTSPVVDQRVALGVEAIALALLAINENFIASQTKTKEN